MSFNISIKKTLSTEPRDDRWHPFMTSPGRGWVVRGYLSRRASTGSAPAEDDLPRSTFPDKPLL